MTTYIMLCKIDDPSTGTTYIQAKCEAPNSGEAINLMTSYNWNRTWAGDKSITRVLQVQTMDEIIDAGTVAPPRRRRRRG